MSLRKLIAKLRAWIQAQQPKPPPPPPVPPDAPPPAPVPPPAPIPPPTPPAPPVANPADAVDITGAALLGPHARRGNPSDAFVLPFLRSASMDQRSLWLDYDGFPHWPSADGERGCSGRNFIFWRRADGKLTGGHFEWTTNGRRDRGLRNIRDGYLDGQSPARGSECWTCTVRNNWSERSNVAPCGVWPG